MTNRFQNANVAAYGTLVNPAAAGPSIAHSGSNPPAGSAISQLYAIAQRQAQQAIVGRKWQSLLGVLFL